MAYQFTQNPVQGTVDVLPNGRKFQFNAGKWDLYTSTLPMNVSPVINATPPIEAAEAPALPNGNKYWFNTATGELNYQYNGAWVSLGSGGAGGSLDVVTPLEAATAPDFPCTSLYWFDTSSSKMYYQHNGAWLPVIPNQTPTPVAPLESETPPTLPNANPFWFKPSTSVLHYQYSDGNSIQWVEI